MSIIEAILQGIIQGLSEFLPISSSGHLSLFQHFFGLSGETAVLTVLVMHLGTLVAVFVAFRQKIYELIFEAFSLLRDIFTLKFSWKRMNGNRRMIIMIIVSILPLFGFYIFRNFFEVLASDTDIIAEGISFLYTSLLLFISIHYSKGNTKTAGETTVPSALFIGVFQGVALLPGVSRSGSTISASLLCGMKREDAVEYSFILGIPVILAGAFTEISDVGQNVRVDVLPLVVGALTAAVVGFFAIKLIQKLVVSDKFKIFAYYTGILGIFVIGLGIAEMFIKMPYMG
ncbi:MAG: undecaprenyl-diphosphate phosphatase [Ruminococcus sp.]|jgi:undecaprenyl-diphosphatase|nr:undecaprenyl-diphosphate phosphatase [Ruminococcus sp.]